MRLRAAFNLLSGSVLLGGAIGGVLFFLQSKPAAISESDLFSLGQVAANHGDCRKAIEYYQKLMKIRPNHEVANEYLLTCQMKLNDQAGAEVTAKRLAGLNPASKGLIRYREWLNPSSPSPQ